MSSSESGPPSLDDLLASAATDEPSQAALDRLEHRLGALLVPPIGGGPSPTGGGAGTAGHAATVKGAAATSALTKWIVGGAVVAALGGGGVAVQRLSRSPAAVPPPAVVAPSPPDAGAESPATTVQPADATEEHGDDHAIAPDPDAAPPPSPAKVGRATPAPARPDALGAEVALLERAQAALRDREPQRALDLAGLHARRFAHGTLAEERERIAIEALLALGRRRAAEQRARSFDIHYPRSVQSSRIHDLLDRAR